MRITFQKRWVLVVCKYVCKCGHKFTRKNNDWYTINPFNTKPEIEIVADMKTKQGNLKRVCPKCKAIVKPLPPPPQTI